MLNEVIVARLALMGLVLFIAGMFVYKAVNCHFGANLARLEKMASEWNADYLVQAFPRYEIWYDDLLYILNSPLLFFLSAPIRKSISDIDCLMAKCRAQEAQYLLILVSVGDWGDLESLESIFSRLFCLGRLKAVTQGRLARAIDQAEDCARRMSSDNSDWAEVIARFRYNMPLF